jgi:hypothetical protein
MQMLKASVLYFTLVFGAGFLLGPIRILWIVPRLGVRTAELLEAPIMLAITIATARTDHSEICHAVFALYAVAYGWHRTLFNAARRAYSRPLATRTFASSVLCEPRSYCRNRVLRDARPFCHHAGSSRTKR